MPESLTASQQDVLTRVITTAVAYCLRLGFTVKKTRAVAIVTACQAIQESGLGVTENARNARNLFGQKAGIRISDKEWDNELWHIGKYRLSRNPEEVDGKIVYDNQTDFWSYASFEASVCSHVDYICGLSGMTRYENPPEEPDALADWLRTPPRQYATDSTYSQKLKSIRDRFDLDAAVDAALRAAGADLPAPQPAPAPAPTPTAPKPQEALPVAEMPITIPAYAGKVYSSTQKPDLIVIHDVECPCEPGRAMNVAKYFSGAWGVPGGVAHYTVDPENTTHSVPENRGCAHCGSFGNKNSVGIEMAGFATDDWYDAAHTKTWKRAGDLLREIAARWGISLNYLSAADLKAGKRNGWTYHMDVAKGLGGTTHMDPGPRFPHEQFKAYVQRTTEAAPAPTQSGTAPAPVPPKPSTSTAVKPLPLLKPGTDGGDAGKALKVFLQGKYSYARNVGIKDGWIGGIGSDSWQAMQRFARNAGLLTKDQTLEAWGPKCWAKAQAKGFKL